MNIGDGSGVLSPQALERLVRPASPPLRPPPLGDRAAVARWRTAVHATWLDGDPPPAARGHRADVIGDVPVLRTSARVDGPLVVYCHGGGYALGAAAVAVPITERLADGAEIVSVDYRLAPEHPCPAAIDDVAAVVDALVDDDWEGRPFAIVGDSAGANLALAVTRRRQAEGRQRPVALALLSPHLDLRPEARTDGAGRRGEDVDDEAAGWLRDAYCGSRLPTDPEVSPVLGDLGGLPPTLVQVGTADSALDQAVRFARRARSAGVEVTLDVWDGLWHAWHYHRHLPEADRALAEVAAFIAPVATSRPRAAPS